MVFFIGMFCFVAGVAVSGIILGTSEDSARKLKKKLNKAQEALFEVEEKAFNNLNQVDIVGQQLVQDIMKIVNTWKKGSYK
jgi:phosphate starvation-inducible protein PhoH